MPAVAQEPKSQETAPITFDQAFEQAKGEHAEQTLPAEVEQPATEEAVEPETETTQTETEEQPAEETGEEAAPPQETSIDESLLSEEEFNALKGDPKALRKALNRNYTQKMQEIAPYRRLIKALETDAIGTIEQLAKGYGVTIQKPETVAEPSSATVELLKSKLPEELEFLADVLAPAVESAVAAKVAPVEKKVEMQGALRDTTSSFEAFQNKHPDWRKYEPKMAELAVKIHAGVDEQGRPTSTQAEYLETLYTLATMGRSNAEKTKQVVAKIAKAAEASESSDSGVSANRVVPKPNGIPSFQEAWDAAKAGSRWE